MPRLSIFLLPHFDDEIGCMGMIRWSLLSKSETVIVHLTKGNRKFAAALTASQGVEDTRKAESRRTIAFLNSGAISVPYWEDLGSEIGVGDSDLTYRLDEVLRALSEKILALLLTIKDAEVYIFTPDFEGGHPDHDSSALLALRLRETLRSSGHVASCWAFPMYRRGLLSPLPTLFRLTPVGGKRTSISATLDLRTRVAGLLSPFLFRSQIGTVLALYLGILKVYLFARHQVAWSLNEIPFQALYEGPGFLYQTRGRFDPIEWRSEVVKNAKEARVLIT